MAPEAVTALTEPLSRSNSMKLEYYEAESGKLNAEESAEHGTKTSRGAADANKKRKREVVEISDDEDDEANGDDIEDIDDEDGEVMRSNGARKGSKSTGGTPSAAKKSKSNDSTATAKKTAKKTGKRQNFVKSTPKGGKKVAGSGTGASRRPTLPLTSLVASTQPTLTDDGKETLAVHMDEVGDFDDSCT
jgi:hypothetical protein